MKTRFLILGFTAIVFCFIACTTQTQVDRSKQAEEAAGEINLSEAHPEIIEKYWKLTEIYHKKVTSDETYRKEPHIILKTEGNRLVGNGGCNAFTGSYELSKGNRISFSKVVSTKMACVNMEIETQLFKVLEAVDNYVIDGDTLVLNKARMAPLARFEAVYMK